MTRDEMLQAVKARDEDMDGIFVYGVLTTGIFCKPSCKSRHARDENMVFFETPAFAASNGFRPCRKCSPDLNVGSEAEILIKSVIHRMEKALSENEGNKIPLKSLAEAEGCSPDHLSRVFKKTLGISGADYYELLRQKAFKKGLQSGNSISEAAYDAGFGSLSRVYEKSSDNLGMSPASYAKGGKGAEIAYVIVDCYLGRMLSAGTHQGICAVYFGDDDEALIGELKTEFPKAEIGQELGDLEIWVSNILDYLQRDMTAPRHIPLDMYGTAFQRKVWQELLKIAPGQTRTYMDIARDLGNEKASRAVGRACATNPVSLIVPCHRVVGTDGKLHGYRWGLPRKDKLRNMERQYA